MNEFSGYVGNKNIKQARSEGKKRKIKSDEYAKSGAGETNENDAAATWRKRVFEIPGARMMPWMHLRVVWGRLDRVMMLERATLEEALSGGQMATRLRQLRSWCCWLVWHH